MIQSPLYSRVPFRASIFLHATPEGRMELFERRFAREGDAILWCRVMTRANPRATGAWLVVCESAGRMELCRQSKIDIAPEAPRQPTPALYPPDEAPVADLALLTADIQGTLAPIHASA